MPPASVGIIDYRDDRFVARFAYDAAVVAELKTLALGTREKASDDWIVERHRPSVARLVRIGRDRSWRFTAAASAALQQLQEEADAAEFSIDVVQGKFGEPWFLCMLGDDYDLQQRVKRIPEADLDDADDSWWVPAFRADACAELLEIASSDDRLEVSPMAWALLEEPDESFELPRSATTPARPRDGADGDDLALGGTWEPTELDFEMHALSSATQEDCFRVAPSLADVLLPYQVAGVRYLCSATRAFLADDLGLGKTVQALATLETLAAYPALVLCPPSLQRQWMREARRFLPEQRTIARPARPFDSVPNVDVLVVDYESLARNHHLLIERGFEAIIADESHYLKHREAQRTRAAVEVASTVPTLRLCLSATPTSGAPIELAAQLEFLGVLDTEFGGFWSFADRYCSPKNDGTGMRFGAARTDELAQRLRSTCYCRRTKAAVLAQLPREPRALHWLELQDRKAYEDVERAVHARLRALATDADRTDADRRERLALVEQLMQEGVRQKAASIARWVTNFLSGGEPLVLFAQHPAVIATLLESFPRALAIRHGDDPPKQRHAVRTFQNGEAPLIVCALHTASAGILLTRASHVAFAEIGWSATSRAALDAIGMPDSTAARIHRIGHARTATAWYLLGDGTIDELVLAVIERERVMAGELHEEVLLEVASEIARMTDPAPASADLPAPSAGPIKIVG